MADDDDGRHSRNSNFVLTNINVDGINNFSIKLRNVGKYCKDSSTRLEKGKIPAIVLFLSPGPSLPFSLFLSAVQNRDAATFSDKLKAIGSLLLTTKNQ